MQLYILLWNQQTCNCDIIAMDRCTQLRNIERNAQIMTFRRIRNLLVVAFTHCNKLFKFFLYLFILTFLRHLMQLPPGYLSKCVTHYVEAFERLIVSVAQKKSNDV